MEQQIITEKQNIETIDKPTSISIDMAKANELFKDLVMTTMLEIENCSSIDNKITVLQGLLDDARNARKIYAEPTKFKIDALRDMLQNMAIDAGRGFQVQYGQVAYSCLLYTSPSPRDRTRYRMPSSA